MNNEIDNLLEDNIHLMTEIDNILDKNTNQINNIKNSYQNVDNDNQISTYYLNRMNNFFYRFYTAIVGKKNPIGKSESKSENEYVNKRIDNKNLENDDLINVMKEKSNQIKNKIEIQNDNLFEINEQVDINNYRIKKNINLTNDI